MKVRIIRAHRCDGRDVYEGDVVELDDRLARIRIEMGWVTPAPDEGARGETPKAGAGTEQASSSTTGGSKPAVSSATPKPKTAKAGGKK